MSCLMDDRVINSHGSGLLARFAEMLQVWRNRSRQRRELAHWSDRDLHDVGLSWSDVVREARKPFWRA